MVCSQIDKYEYIDIYLLHIISSLHYELVAILCK